MGAGIGDSVLYGPFTVSHHRSNFLKGMILKGECRLVSQAEPRLQSEQTAVKVAKLGPAPRRRSGLGEGGPSRKERGLSRGELPGSAAQWGMDW